jgi:pentachlorophenol monooxygenase
VRGFGEIDYRYKSPVIAEDVPSPCARRHLVDAPAPGERVGDVLFGGRRKQRLFDVLRGTQHVLLLFAADGDEIDRLERIRASVQASHGKVVRTYVVAAEGSNRSDAVLEDTDLALRRCFRAYSASLYLIRPDGRVGYRALPSDRELLERYLQRIFR